MIHPEDTFEGSQHFLPAPDYNPWQQRYNMEVGPEEDCRDDPWGEQQPQIDYLESRYETDPAEYDDDEPITYDEMEPPF